MAFARSVTLVRALGRATRTISVAPLSSLARYASSASQVVKSKQSPLLTSLNNEIAAETSSSPYGDNIERLKGVTKLQHYEITDEPGSARIALKREFNGQQIRIDVDVTPMPSDEEVPAEDEEEGYNHEEEGTEEGYRMLITIDDAKKNKTMQIGSFITQELRIHRVTMYDGGKAPSADEVFGGSDEIPTYAGPVFDELDDTLQDAFYTYLESLGIDNDLAYSLSDYATNKEQLEYIRWLKNARDFVA